MINDLGIEIHGYEFINQPRKRDDPYIYGFPILYDERNRFAKHMTDYFIQK